MQLLGYKCKSICHAIIVTLLYVAVILLLLPEILGILNFDFDSNDGVVGVVTQVLRYIQLIILILVLAYGIKHTIIPNIGRRRDAQSIINSLKSDDIRSPIVDRATLRRRIIGEDATFEVATEVDSIIQNNIDPIKKFIFDKEKTLLVDGRWGVGKTTYTLVAVSEILHDGRLAETDYRFIYESAFKYTSEFNEFKKDVLRAMRSILSEQNVFRSFIFEELIGNLCRKKFGLPEFKAGKTTTDIINSLNRAYEKKKGKKGMEPFRMIIIIDDIDRLQGEEIVQTLAFLSVIRKLDFVKIILPIDRSVIIDQLNSIKITDPQFYINKYLPEQLSVTIQSNYDVVTNISSKKVRKELGASYDDSQVQPILECLYIKVFSNRLKQNMERAHVDNLGDWPWFGGEYPKELSINNEYDSRYIFEAREYLRDKLVAIGDHKSLDYLGRASNFESIIYMMRFKNKRPSINGSYPLRVDEELYEKCIKLWVLPFVKSKWKKLSLPIREMDDICNSYIQKIKSAVNPEMMPHEIFVRAYNIIFPEQPITDEMIYDEK